MLAGSDIPPPPGFAWIVIGLVVICTSIALALPWLSRVRAERGVVAVLARTTTIGGAVGLLLAAAFSLFDSGESSSPPKTPSAYLIWFTVLAIVGAANGVVVGLTASLLRPH